MDDSRSGCSIGTSVVRPTRCARGGVARNADCCPPEVRTGAPPHQPPPERRFPPAAAPPPPFGASPLLTPCCARSHDESFRTYNLSAELCMSPSSPPPERSAVPRRTLALFTVLTAIMLITLVAASCSPHSSSRVAPADAVVRAGASYLVVAHIVDNVDHQRVMARAATGDTTAKERGRVTIEQHIAPVNGATNVMLYKLGHYAGRDFSDTMSMTRDGLSPSPSACSSASTVKIIHYDGDRLHETIQVGDSTPRVLDRTLHRCPCSDSISSSSSCSHFRCAPAFARFFRSTPRATTRSRWIRRR